MKNRLHAFWLLILISLLIHPSLSKATDNALENVTLQLQYKHQFEFAGFYAAKEKGFYQ